METCQTCGRPANSPHTVWSFGFVTEQCRDVVHDQYVMPVIPMRAGIVPITVYPFDGHLWLELDCRNHEEWGNLPPALSYEGKVFGKSGWNSDYQRAYYTTRKTVAYVL